MRLNLAELMEAITSCLLLTVNSPYFGRGSNLIHNWKWLLWSICYAFVVPTSATQAPPWGCTWGICFFSLSFSPSISFSLSFDAFFSMTIHTSVEIALNFYFSQNALLSSCLSVWMPFISHFLIFTTTYDVFFYLSACAHIMQLCLSQSELHHPLKCLV